MTSLVRLFLVTICIHSTGLIAEENTLTWDLGVATGRYRNPDPTKADVTYTEANLGLNWNFMDYFTWRNSVFGRFPSGGKTTGGLDTGMRAHANVDFGANSGLMTFAGGGWRFYTDSASVPFGEAGLQIRAGGLNIGGGAKVFLHDWVKSSLPTYVQYFIILSGAGVL